MGRDGRRAEKEPLAPFSERVRLTLETFCATAVCALLSGGNDVLPCSIRVGKIGHFPDSVVGNRTQNRVTMIARKRHLPFEQVDVIFSRTTVYKDRFPPTIITRTLKKVVLKFCHVRAKTREIVEFVSVICKM